MKLRELLNIDNVIAQHTDRLRELAEKNVYDLSISEMSFVKMVSSGSITAMRKTGASNERILMTEKSAKLNDTKVKIFLKSLPAEKLAELLAGLH